MSRSARLIDLIQALRRRRRPVAAAELARECGVSPRTIYRDIATLVAQGAPIEGEAGFGYVLKPGFFLPPLMFGPDEIDAIILGLRFVAQRGDADLGRAAADALAKIVAVLPPGVEDGMAANGLLAAPLAAASPAAKATLAILRQALRDERKLRLEYVDTAGQASRRLVWPVALGFFEGTEVLAAWCEMRDDFRHFRLDRIAAAEPTGIILPKRRRILIADWRVREGLDRTF
ncbi:MAG TPA: YafY family protein [Lichenihabitans sp.]|nr:YafY family protein [Lichenihabitans sp.]